MFRLSVLVTTTRFLIKRTHIEEVGLFNTFDDAASCAHNVCGCATSNDYILVYEGDAS